MPEPAGGDSRPDPQACAAVRGELVAFLNDELEAARRADVQAHLAACRACSEEMEGFRAAQQAMGRLRVRSASGEFPGQLRERIARKVAELRARGSVRFRTGRERVEASWQPQEWPGLAEWLRRRRRTVATVAAAAAAVLVLLAVLWTWLLGPYFRRRAEETERGRRRQQAELYLSDRQMARARRAAPRQDLAADAEGAVAGLAGLADGPVRLVPWRSPDGRAACLFVFGAADAQRFLARIAGHGEYHRIWSQALQEAPAAEVRGGRLVVPEKLRAVLDAPGGVAALRLPEHLELWSADELEDYFGPRVRLEPPGIR